MQTCTDRAGCAKTAPSPYQVRTKSAPSSLHACISLAPNMHDNRAVYAVSMRVSRIINRQNPEPLSLPWSEQRANKERTRSEQRAIKGRKTGNVITMLVVAGFWFGEVFFDKNDFSPRKIFAMRYWVVPPAFLKDKS